jgi:hypothetical protein
VLFLLPLYSNNIYYFPKVVDKGASPAHPQFSFTRMARGGERWMRNPGGKGFSRVRPDLSAKEGGIEGLPRNLG